MNGSRAGAALAAVGLLVLERVSRLRKNGLAFKREGSTFVDQKTGERLRLFGSGSTSTVYEVLEGVNRGRLVTLSGDPSRLLYAGSGHPSFPRTGIYGKGTYSARSGPVYAVVADRVAPLPNKDELAWHMYISMLRDMPEVSVDGPYGEVSLRPSAAFVGGNLAGPVPRFPGADDLVDRAGNYGHLLRRPGLTDIILQVVRARMFLRDRAGEASRQYVLDFLPTNLGIDPASGSVVTFDPLQTVLRGTFVFGDTIEELEA